MTLFTIIQNSEAYNSGYDIGYVIGKFLPYVIVIILAYFIFKYIQKKSKK